MNDVYKIPPHLDRLLVTKAIDAAVTAARTSPCAKDQRGAAVWHHDYPHRLAAAPNGPPSPFFCDGSPACRAGCGKLAVHAEMRALGRYLRQCGAGNGFGMRGMSVLHIRVVDGIAVPSGPPSCVACSRDMLEAGVASVWLWHETGWCEYPAAEFHALSLAHAKHRLPVIRQ